MSTSSVVSEEELLRIEAELEKLERVCDHTTLKFSDIRMLLEKVKFLSGRVEGLNAMLVRAQEIGQRIHDKCYHSGNAQAADAASLAEYIVWHDEIDKLQHHWIRVQKLIVVAAERLAAGEAIGPDDALALDIRRASKAINKLNDDDIT